MGKCVLGLGHPLCKRTVNDRANPLKYKSWEMSLPINDVRQNQNLKNG